MLRDIGGALTITHGSKWSHQCFLLARRTCVRERTRISAGQVFPKRFHSESTMDQVSLYRDSTCAQTFTYTACRGMRVLMHSNDATLRHRQRHQRCQTRVDAMSTCLVRSGAMSPYAVLEVPNRSTRDTRPVRHRRLARDIVKRPTSLHQLGSESLDVAFDRCL